jgi:hypothetical protein
MKNPVHEDSERPNISFFICFFDEFHIAAMFLDKFWRNVVFGADKVFAFGLMFTYFGEQLLWSDVLLKSEQLEDG